VIFTKKRRVVAGRRGVVLGKNSNAANFASRGLMSLDKIPFHPGKRGRKFRGDVGFGNLATFQGVRLEQLQFCVLVQHQCLRP
jgi:hypothetical protein